MPTLKRLALACACALLMASVVNAQEFGELDQPAPKPTVSPSVQQPKPLSFAQRTARYQAEQAMMRIQWNKWIGYEPLRPHMNASYMSNGSQRYYIPSRGLVVTGGSVNAWYW